MLRSFDAFDWLWAVSDHPGVVWSSLARAYLPADDARVAEFLSSDNAVSRVANETDLSDVLRSHGVRPVLPSADDVRAECQRRMMTLLGARDAQHLALIVSNGQRESLRLMNKKAVLGHEWDAADTARAAMLAQVDAAIERLRARSNAMEPSPPSDYTSDARWA